MTCNALLEKNNDYEWDVESLLSSNNGSDKLAFVLMLLNTPVKASDFLYSLWNKAVLRVTVDGGTDRWFSIFKSSAGMQQSVPPFDMLPDLITGDMDSVNPNTISFCRKCGIDIVYTPDQDKTDFEKALEVVSEKVDEQVKTVLVWTEFEGRLDQSIGNLNQLYKVHRNPKLERFNVIFMGHNSLTWLLQSGTHTIYIPKFHWTKKSYCALLPIGNPCYVTTTGLKWNLSK